jgi:Transposase zinc-binding domain
MLRRYTWEKAREKLQHYRSRSPEASSLYQIVYHSRDDLQFQWESKFQHQYGCLRDEVLKTYDEYLNCGILAHGAARVYCDGCKHSLLIAFSCKRRGVCPSCGAKRAVKFAEHIYSAVIEDVPHSPHRLHHPKTPTGILSVRPQAQYHTLSCRLGGALSGARYR